MNINTTWVIFTKAFTYVSRVLQKLDGFTKTGLSAKWVDFCLNEVDEFWPVLDGWSLSPVPFFQMKGY